MRRASIYLALLGLAFLGVPAAASAVPSVKFQAKAVPIPKNLAKKSGPTWPGTGNYFGAPAAVEAKFTISGTEYDEGHPAPLRKVVTYLPKGTKINAKGFQTCAPSTLENKEPEKCKPGSLASPPGEADGVVNFGSDPVREKVLVQAYFAPGGGLSFWIEGRTPAQIEEFASGKIEKSTGQFSYQVNAAVPLIETVPGGWDASAETIDVKVGAAHMVGKKLVSYGTVPTTCPKGGFPVKAELWFGVGASESEWEKTTATALAPCPKASVKGKGKK
ncbi:MAG TPA: hypothetical protein VGF95_04005 [Solirubrobacteraceae bacterium]